MPTALSLSHSKKWTARASEQGRGFAVVATEVRNLAQRSAGAAKEIKALINDSVNKVKSGAELVKASGTTLHEIVEEIKKPGDLMSEIATASNVQVAGIEQVNKAMSVMDADTQQNAALVEQTSAASKSLEDEAQDLLKLIEFFKLHTVDAVAFDPYPLVHAWQRHNVDGSAAFGNAA